MQVSNAHEAHLGWQKIDFTQMAGCAKVEEVNVIMHLTLAGDRIRSALLYIGHAEYTFAVTAMNVNAVPSETDPQKHGPLLLVCLLFPDQTANTSADKTTYIYRCVEDHSNSKFHMLILLISQHYQMMLLPFNQLQGSDPLFIHFPELDACQFQGSSVSRWTTKA